jgi:hypothetical protein
MAKRWDDPKHWRERGEQLRTLAQGMNDPDAKEQLLKLAGDYEKLASRAQERTANRGAAKLASGAFQEGRLSSTNDQHGQ